MSSMLKRVWQSVAGASCASGMAVAASYAPASVTDLRVSTAAVLPASIQAGFTPAPQSLLPQGMPAPAPAVYDPLLATIDTWKSLQQSDRLPFASYAEFLLAHPGWPGETSRRAVAETALASGEAQPGLAIRYFGRFPPVTGAGNIRYAEALASVGRMADAGEQVRKAWRRGALRATDEAVVLSRFGSALTPEDRDARIDMLLWQGATTAAARDLPYASAARQPILAARLAYRTNAATASARGYELGPGALGDAGYLADRATWLRNAGGGLEARALLAQRRALAAPPASPEKWFEVLLVSARAAASDRQYTTAFDIARQVDDAYLPGTDVSTRSLSERDDYTSLVWLAGQTALRNLGRPRDAIGMFDRYARGSKSPSTQSKGLYWAGRAAEQAGDAQLAQSYLVRAAAFSDLFYGQLAAERIGRPLRPPAPLGAVAQVDPETRRSYADREIVRAARRLGELGRYEDQSAFIRQIAAAATSDTDHALAAELAQSINRPDLGVMVGRSALQNGLSDYSAAGFPQVVVPAAANDLWTIVHAIARQESQFNRTAVSHAGARGLMQLMPATAREQAGKLGLGWNPSSLTSDTGYNITIGSSYFARLYAIYGSYPLAVAAYNAGGGNVNRWLAANGDPRTSGIDIIDWIEAIPIFETKNYVQRVLENAVVYDLMNPARARSRGPSNMSWYLGKRSPG